MNSAMEAKLGAAGQGPRVELDEEDYYPQGGWDTVFLVSLLLLGLPANGLMAWLAASQARQGAGTRLALLLLSLALSDLLFLAAAVFQILEIQHGGHWPLGTAACRFYYFLWGVSYSSGLFLLAALSLDRCLLALCPRWYPERRPARLPLWVCSGVWVLATLFSVPWLVFPEAAVWWYDLVICLDFWDSEELPLRVFEVLGGFMPFLLLLGTHVITQAATCSSACCCCRCQPRAPPATRGFARVAKTILSAYVVLRLPYQLAQLLYLAFLCDLYPGYLLWEALVYSDYLVLLSSCLSPFLCLLASADLRGLLHALLASFATALCEEQPGTFVPARPQDGTDEDGLTALEPEPQPLPEPVAWSRGNPPVQSLGTPAPVQLLVVPLVQPQVNPTIQPQSEPAVQALQGLLAQSQVNPPAQVKPQLDPPVQAQVNPQYKSNSTVQAQVNPQTQANLQSQSDPMGQAQVNPQSQSDPTGQAQTNPQPQSDPTGQAQVNPQLQSDPTGQAQVNLEPQSDLTGQAQVNLEPQSDPTGQGQAQVNPQPQSDPTGQTQMNPQSQSDPTGQSQMNPQSQLDPTVQAQESPQSQVNPQPQSDPTVQSPPSPKAQPQLDPKELPEENPEVQGGAANPVPPPSEEKSPTPDTDPTSEDPENPAKPMALECEGPGRAPPEASAGPT